MMDIMEIATTDEKARICEVILRALPGWFGIEESLVNYIAEVRNLPFYAALGLDSAIGFAALKLHNAHTAEICVMGVLPAWHRMGMGRLLVERCVRHCVDSGMEFLTVKTLDASREDEGYERTRRFYYSMGFRPLEVFPLLWDEANPCLFMARYVAERCLRG